MNGKIGIKRSGRASLLRRPKVIAAVGIVAIALVAAGCGSSDDDGGSAGGQKTRTLGFAWTDTAIDVYRPIIAGAKAEAEKRNFRILESNNGGDVAKQLADIQTWTGQGVDAITILPLDPAATKNLAQDALDAGIVVVGYGDQIEGNQGYTIFDNAQGGKLLGDAAAAWINENLSGEAEVAFLTNDTQKTAKDRIDLAEQEILAQTDATVVGRVEAASSADALPATQSLLSAHPNLNVVLCVADDGCLGAASAFDGADKDPAKVFLGGWDGALPVLQAIDKGGYIKATAALDLEAIGRSIVSIPANAIDGFGPTEVNNEYVLATKSDPTTLKRLIDAYGD